MRLDIFKDCMRLKLFLLEFDLLKPNLYSGDLVYCLMGGQKLLHLLHSHQAGKLYHMESGV